MKKRNEQEKRKMKKGKKVFLTFLFPLFYFFFCNVFLFSQTAERIEKLLQQDKVTYGDAALLVLEAAGHIESEKRTNAGDAFSLAVERGWLPKIAGAQDAISLERLSLLIMRSFGLKGGLLYSLAKNPHYAFRELVYKDIIRGKAYPKMFVSGDKLLVMINRILEPEETEGIEGE
jgi:hypothetical protein